MSIQTPATPQKDDSRGDSKREAPFEVLPIHLVDLGKAKAKDIKALKRGGGKLHQSVVEAIGDIELNLGEDATGKTLLPVVVVVERKRKRRGALQLF
jgi:hypothetical protein